MASLKHAGEASAPAVRKRAAPTTLLVLAGMLALFLATQYAGVLRIPFINDDYVFLEKTRTASFASLWRLEALTFHWYRPWSREFHYWWMQRAFGPSEPAFHLASLALWLGVMLAWFTLARRFLGPGASALALAGVAAMSAWAVPVLWVAGVQESWVLLWSLLSLGALARGRTMWSALAFALALLSKETAAVLPAIAWLMLVVAERRGPREATRRLVPHAALVAAWAAVHPLLGGRLWSHAAATTAAAAPARGPLGADFARTLGALVNLDAIPQPDVGARFLAPGLAGAAILVAIVLWVRRREDAPRTPRDAAATTVPRREASAHAGARRDASISSSARLDERAALLFGAGWAMLGWLPSLAPAVGWHSYYTLLGAMGAWLAIAAWLERAPRLALGVIAALALLHAAQASTPSRDWGAEWYQRRAGSFLAFMRDDLERKRPDVAPHSRLWFTEVPDNVGFLTTGGPALRVWYRDTTLRAGFYGDYVRRSPGAPGEDLFFRYDSTAGWIEIAPGRVDPAEFRAQPRWERDHRDLAAMLARAEDWPAAAAQYETLAQANPASPEYALDAAICYETMRDWVRAGRWYDRVLASPAASEADLGFARRFALRVQASR